MNTILKVIEQREYDRNVFLTYENDQIIGINFHQGIGEILHDFMNPCPALTKFFECISMKMPSATLIERINLAIDIYFERIILENHVTTLPGSQKKIIQKALEFYISMSKKFNSLPTDTENFEMYDAEQLLAMMNYGVSVSLSQSEYSNFEEKHGISFPEYI